MTTILRLPLSGKTDWRPIGITEDATPGDVIHTATSTTDVVDEVWLWCNNYSGAVTQLWLEFDDGSVTTEKMVSLPSDGEYLVCPGITYAGGLIIRAFVGTGGATDGTVVIDGHVNRLDQS